MSKVIDFLNGLDTELDLVYVYEEGISFDEYRERVHDYISEQDIIYYSEAMEYLNKNDNSLKESLNLAAELGYETQNLNSETLATLLYQQNLMEEFSEISNEIEEFFNSIE